MKVKFLAVLGLAAVAGLAGCGGGSTTNTNTNTATVTNTTNTNMTMATPMSTPMATPMASPDAAMQKVVEDAMKKKGLNDVVVSATSTEVTLRGTVAKGKLAEAVQAATEASKGRRINNQLTEK